MISSRSRFGRAAIMAIAALFLAAGHAEARAGRGGSGFGSRGARTFDAPAATRTAPTPLQPIQRSTTPQPAPGTETIAPKGEVTGVKVKNLITGETNVVPCTGFFVAIGHTPNSELFKDFLELHENGYLKTKPGTASTNIPGVFAAGDIQDFVYRQAVTAAGSGCMAALEAERFIAANSEH